MFITRGQGAILAGLIEHERDFWSTAVINSEFKFRHSANIRLELLVQNEGWRPETLQSGQEFLDRPRAQDFLCA